MKKLALAISAAAIVAAGCSGSSSSPSASSIASTAPTSAAPTATATQAPTPTPAASHASGSLGMKYLLPQAQVYLVNQEGYTCTAQGSNAIACTRHKDDRDDTATLTADASNQVVKVEATTTAKVAVQAKYIIAESFTTLAMLPASFTDAGNVSVWVTGNPGANITQDFPSAHVAIMVSGTTGTLVATSK